MASVVFTPKQIRVLEYTVIGVTLFMMLFGLLTQIENWRLPGVALVLVGVTFVTLLNLLKAHVGGMTARIDALERRLDATQRPG